MSTRDDGLKILQALGKYGELIMSAYEDNKGRLDYSDNNVRAVDDMVRLRLALFDLPDNNQPRLNSTVMALLDQSLRTSRLKMVNADVGESIEGIEFLANEYLAAKQAGGQADAQGYLSDLEANVLSLCDNLMDQARSIWRQIDSDFGSVSRLSGKIALNKNALRKVSNLLQSLDLINAESLYTLGMRDKNLRGILQVRLPLAIDSCRKDLSDALHRLNKMLFKLSQLEARACMVNDFVHHSDAGEGFDLSGYADSTEVPDIFRAVEPLPAFGAADPKNATLELDLAAIIGGLRKETPPEEKQAAKPVSAGGPDNQRETLLVSPFKEAVREVFVECLTENRMVSGMACFEKAPEGTDMEIWLYGLMAEYSAMSQQDRAYFEIQYPGRSDVYFTGNYYANDVVICPR